jgi:hypothetical protein
MLGQADTVSREVNTTALDGTGEGREVALAGPLAHGADPAGATRVESACWLDLPWSPPVNRIRYCHRSWTLLDRMTGTRMDG